MRLLVCSLLLLCLAGCRHKAPAVIALGPPLFIVKADMQPTPLVGFDAPQVLQPLKCFMTIAELRAFFFKTQLVIAPTADQGESIP